jgi:hypothetical protein
MLALAVRPQDRQLHVGGVTREAQTIRVIVRFLLRMIVLLVFAAFSSIRFDQTLTLLLVMSTILSAVLVTFKREEPFGPAFNHWDEAIAYAAPCCLLIAFNVHVPR